MNSSRMKGLAVVSIADGEKLGTIDRVYVDPTRLRVVGFRVHGPGGLLQRGTSSLVDVADIRALGSDALTLNDRSALREPASGRIEGVADLEDLAKDKVVTESGTYVGEVVSFEFDERTFGLKAVEVSPGFFKANKVIPVELMISVGTDLVVVADAVCDPGTEERGAGGEG